MRAAIQNRQSEIAHALGFFACILGWVIVGFTICFWAFELGRALGRGVLIP